MCCVWISDTENVFITCPKCLERIWGLPSHLLIGDREQSSCIKHSIFKDTLLCLRQTQISLYNFDRIFQSKKENHQANITEGFKRGRMQPRNEHNCTVLHHILEVFVMLA